MDQAVKSHLEGIKFGEMQRHRNVAVFPVFSAVDGSPNYLTMKEAMAGGFLAVTEVSAGGVVPELKVINSASVAVLILDGEELAGAKQNRIVNTSILLRRQSETIIPVSCTEQGRWSYVSEHFDDSGHIAAHRVRGVTKQSVSACLKAGGRFDSDQGAVWDNVASVLEDCDVASNTGAMKDAFESRAKDIDEYLGKFPCLPKQKGLLVLIDGKVAGMDMVSLESACAALHPKLVKSYAMEALVSRGPTGRSSRRVRRRPSLPRPWRARASASSPWATAGTSASRGRALWARPSSTTRRSSTRPSSAPPRPRRRATWRASPAEGGSAGES